MLAEFVVALICIGLCFTNVYVISIFVVHRHQLTAKTLLQGNLAFCNLLASYYLSAATFEEALYGTGRVCTDDAYEKSTGWNMTLCSLSASSWALTIVLWFHANQRRLGNLKREVTVTVTYGFVGATWLYFTVLVLTHMLGIYGWTFDSHDTEDIKSWTVFVLIPFLLPWLVQAWMFWEINPAGFFNSVKGLFWERAKKELSGGVESKDEMVIIENEEEKTEVDKEDSCNSVTQTLEEILSLTTSLFVCGIISVLLAVLATRIFSSEEDLLPKFFISIVCVTWINCSVSPFLLFSGETEVEASRKCVDTVIRAVVKSVCSYLSLYVPDSGVWSRFVERLRRKGEVVSVDNVTKPSDDESAEAC